MNWDDYFILMAKMAATKSKDRSTVVGAVIVDEHHNIVSTGFNGFPHGIDDTNPSYHERPLKYKITEHAERNAIYQAAAGRGGTRDCTMYLAHNPYKGICTDCARAIIQAGIKKVVGPDISFEGKGDVWAADVRTAYDMLMEAGVELRFTGSKIQ